MRLRFYLIFIKQKDPTARTIESNPKAVMIVRLDYEAGYFL